MNPQQTVAKTIASKSFEYPESNGQLMNTDVEGSTASSPSPKRGRREVCSFPDNPFISFQSLDRLD
jgi:hypothetical protein